MSSVWPDPETDVLARLSLRRATDVATPEDRERLDDALRVAEVAGAWRAASAADDAAAGERDRARLRARALPFLDRASADLDRELTERRERSGLARDFEIALLDLAEPHEREAAYAERERAAEALRPLVEERQALRDEAARRCGASGELELLAAAEPVRAELLAQPFETGAVAPFDDVVVRAQRDWMRATALRLGAAPHPVDSVLAASLVEHTSSAPRRELQRWVRDGVRALGRGAQGAPAVQDAPPGRAWSWFEPGIERGTVRLGWLAGPAAAACAIGALGRGSRAGFVQVERGVGALLLADPAFDVAAATLFGRVLLDPAAAAHFGARWAPRALVDLGREARLAPRVAWAYVELACSMRAGRAGDERVVEVLERACGRRTTFDERPSAAELGAAPSRLRGVVLALLLEERLRTRFGRAWPLERAAGAWIRELWEAEPGETAESLARAVGLGTMDASPVFEACRPRHPAAP